MDSRLNDSMFRSTGLGGSSFPGGGGNSKSATSLAMLSSANLGSLVEQKERELSEINAFRISTLESVLETKQAELDESSAALSKLKDDFKYNLKLLEDRDAELSRYDKAFLKLKGIIADRDASLAAAASDLAAKDASLAELQASYAALNAAKTQAEAAGASALEAAKWEAVAAAREAEEVANEKLRGVERALEEAKSDLVSAKMTAENEKAAAAAAAAAAASVRESEVSAELAGKEAELGRLGARLEGVEEKLAAAEDVVVKLEGMVEVLRDEKREALHALEEFKLSSQAKFDRLHEAKAVEDGEMERAKARIQELQAALEETKEKGREEREATRVETDRIVRQMKEEHDAAARQAEDAHRLAVDQLKADAEAAKEAAKEQVAALENQVRDGVAAAQAAAWEAADKYKDLVHKLEAVEHDAALEAKASAQQIEQAASSLAARELELKELRSELETAKDALAERQRTIATLEDSVETAEARAAQAEAKTGETDAAWRMRSEKVQSQLQLRHEKIVRTLQAQRDDALARADELQNTLDMAQMAAGDAAAEASRKLDAFRLQLDSISAERDILASEAAAARTRAAASDVITPSAAAAPAASSAAVTRELATAKAELEEANDRIGRQKVRISELETQNTRIREVVKSMRVDMEELSASAASAARDGGANSALVAELRAQISSLQARNAGLEAASASAKSSAAAAETEQVKLLRSQLDDLNSIIEKQRAELFELLGSSRESSSRIHELEAALASAREQNGALASQLAMAQASASDRESQVISLSHQLAEAHARAQTAALVAPLTAAAPEVTTAHNPVLADLHSQIAELRARVDNSGPSSSSSQTRQESGAPPAIVYEMRAQLDEARADIKRLAGERDKLLDLSNLLKSDLNKVVSDRERAAHIRAHAPAPSASPVRGGGGDDRLGAIEREMAALSAQNAVLRNELASRAWAQSSHPSYGDLYDDDDVSIHRGNPAGAAPNAPSSPVLSAKLTGIRSQLGVVGSGLGGGSDHHHHHHTSSSPVRSSSSSRSSKSRRGSSSTRKKKLQSLRKKREALIQRRKSVRNYNVRE